ncbi:glycine betaine carnitine ABC transporter, membrane-spanning subunit [Ligilactobacillus apodemi DSM 16634 = JCM 16172]|uniref:Glycine betaine carnitine ABC transporter, membrane-spanning subunit n=1 Tax=Ligilactobacillus apodemi DSM 16634 = JCM 16172 TaxID=1423724 RepID=A0A0R1TXD6_9LACO|nr:proline/glycine betaine ABC transporter permease [Ligilactobacillus apodemi]KRL84884.1 glycine betaine carnitine ABC transporter, membrane-spanning subunit [Ligilactobacillus apodemi DSM 16634 = JCM 16172]MBD5069059.1 proline/glycine betaine ABC transporter permease [Lactobacillus sp.]MBD5069286.1 proline/glycine betaine ABC transporter permease [Lactobacillus sp.]MCR1901015.1 proline/glycine betaine ABC transporter permease [Ligilactobacillus apodemi]
MPNIPKLPLEDWINDLVDQLSQFTGFFNAISNFISSIANAFQWFFDLFPIWLFILILLLVTYYLRRGQNKWGLLTLELVGLLFIWNMGYWRDMTQTLTLVLTSCLLVYIVGIPLGIWMAKSKTVKMIVQPILDFMQTMPAFVYLIPAVAFFGIGTVPGVIASVIFAMPPTVRMTDLGIRQVPEELIEAADSYGSTSWQKLFKLQLPIARNTIMSGVTQSLMLALSMVVIASMIGALGLGNKVYFAVGRNNAGAGFTAGLAIVILAIILDRLSHSLQSNQKKK